jgi:hypothetical protein
MVHRSSVPGFRPTQSQGGPQRGRPTDIAARPQRPPQKTAQRKPSRGRKSGLSRIDVILIVAIAATVIALVAMVFGLSSANQMPFMN